MLAGDLDGQLVDPEELLGHAVVLAVVELVRIGVEAVGPEGRAAAGADPLTEGVIKLGASTEADDHRFAFRPGFRLVLGKL